MEQFMAVAIIVNANLVLIATKQINKLVDVLGIL